MILTKTYELISGFSTSFLRSDHWRSVFWRGRNVSMPISARRSLTRFSALEFVYTAYQAFYGFFSSFSGGPVSGCAGCGVSAGSAGCISSACFDCVSSMVLFINSKTNKKFSPQGFKNCRREESPHYHRQPPVLCTNAPPTHPFICGRHHIQCFNLSGVVIVSSL